MDAHTAAVDQIIELFLNLRRFMLSAEQIPDLDFGLVNFDDISKAIVSLMQSITLAGISDVWYQARHVAFRSCLC